LPPDVTVFSAFTRPNDVLQERLDPLSSDTLSSEAFQPTNFNGINQPALNQENLIGVGIQNPNFASYRALETGDQPGPLVSSNPVGLGDPLQPSVRTNPLGTGAPAQSLSPERIMPPAYRPTNNDGVPAPTLNRTNILGSGGPPGPVLTAENLFE
jgi:hypothetical protein